MPQPDFHAVFSAHQRQVHLDFHTSPWIPEVACEFDAHEFAETFRRAHVNSVTVFAKCHHGMCYYPTKTGTAHPHLGGRDLLGEQLDALHRAGIRAPIYTPVAWEEDVAARFPQWRQMTREGRFIESGAVPGIDLPGKWKFNNFLHPGFQDYLEAHVLELLERYGDAVDGLFFDLLVMAPGACWSEPARRFREKHGLLGDAKNSDDSATFERFQAAAQAAFAERFTALIHARNPRATVFYNAGNDQTIEAAAGPRRRMERQTHAELESLPTGMWGYHHFPRTARAIAHWGKPWIGQTGRFQKMWGDFGGYKPLPALEFECFRTQAMGGANGVGDQLHPRGRLDAATYRLIGEVYRQCAAAEPFFAGSGPLPQIGIFSAHAPGLDAMRSAKSEEGCIQLAEAAHYEAAMLDEATPQEFLNRLELLILPDSTRVTPTLAAKLEVYYKQGGKLLLSCEAGRDERGAWALPFLPVTTSGGPSPLPLYWRASAEFDAELALADRVVYERGVEVCANEKERAFSSVLMERVLPYFDRSDLRFCSHFQSPPQPQADGHPALLVGDRWAFFAEPIFREYRQSGNQAVRSAWRAAMGRLVGEAPFGADLPGSVLLIPRRRGSTLLLTLLRYIPVRKALDADVIEERGSFAGETLRFSAPLAHVKTVVDFETGEPLPQTAPGAFALPCKQGRLLLEIPDAF